MPCKIFIVFWIHDAVSFKHLSGNLYYVKGDCLFLYKIQHYPAPPTLKLALNSNKSSLINATDNKRSSWAKVDDKLNLSFSFVPFTNFLRKHCLQHDFIHCWQLNKFTSGAHFVILFNLLIISLSCFYENSEPKTYLIVSDKYKCSTSGSCIFRKRKAHKLSSKIERNNQPVTFLLAQSIF